MLEYKTLKISAREYATLKEVARKFDILWEIITSMTDTNLRTAIEDAWEQTKE